jgi:hypothetical protein
MKQILFLLLLFSFAYRIHAQGPQDIKICPGDTIVLQAFSPGAESYQWYRNESELPGRVSDTFVVVREGSYYARSFGFESCPSDLSYMIHVEESVPIAFDDFDTVAPSRSVLITPLENDQAGCYPLIPSTVTITRNPTQGMLNRNSDGTIKYTAFSTATGTDLFQYKVTDEYGYTTNEAIANILIDLSCAVVYPNPVNEQLYLKINNIHIYNLRLIDAAGKVMYRAKVTKEREVIPMQSYADGFYIVEFLDINNSQLCSVKVIKKS